MCSHSKGNFQGKKGPIWAFMIYRLLVQWSLMRRIGVPGMLSFNILFVFILSVPLSSSTFSSRGFLLSVIRSLVTFCLVRDCLYCCMFILLYSFLSASFGSANRFLGVGIFSLAACFSLGSVFLFILYLLLCAAHSSRCSVASLEYLLLTDT